METERNKDLFALLSRINIVIDLGPAWATLSKPTSLSLAQAIDLTLGLDQITVL